MLILLICLCQLVSSLNSLSFSYSFLYASICCCPTIYNNLSVSLTPAHEETSLSSTFKSRNHSKHNTQFTLIHSFIHSLSSRMLSSNSLFIPTLTSCLLKKLPRDQVHKSVILSNILWFRIIMLALNAVQKTQEYLIFLSQDYYV